MKHFTAAIRQSIQERNWFAAIFMALAMPDICGALETPDEGVGNRYKRWFDENLGKDYSPFIKPDDIYYIRCAVLHQGAAALPKAKVMIIEPPADGSKFHRNVFQDGAGSLTIQLQIDCLCEDIADAVDLWVDKVDPTSDVQRRLSELLVVEPPSAMRPFIVIGPH